MGCGCGKKRKMEKAGTGQKKCDTCGWILSKVHKHQPRLLRSTIALRCVNPKCIARGREIK